MSGKDKINGVQGFYGGMDMVKVMFGEHAMETNAQIMLQEQGRSDDGVFYLTSAVAIIHTREPLLTQAARDAGCPHELIVGRLIIQPAGKFASRRHIGSGIAGLLKGEGMFPMGNDFQTLDNGMPTDLPKSYDHSMERQRW